MSILLRIIRGKPELPRIRPEFVELRALKGLNVMLESLECYLLHHRIVTKTTRSTPQKPDFACLFRHRVLQPSTHRVINRTAHRANSRRLHRETTEQRRVNSRRRTMHLDRSSGEALCATMGHRIANRVTKVAYAARRTIKSAMHWPLDLSSRNRVPRVHRRMRERSAA